jgi:hypothetical protein
MTTSVRANHRALAAALRHRILEGPGDAHPGARQAAAQRAAGGSSTQSPYDDLARQIGESARGVTDAQVAGVLAVTGSEKASVEITIASASMSIEVGYYAERQPRLHGCPHNRNQIHLRTYCL